MPIAFFKWSSLLITTIAFTLIFSFWPTVSDAASFGYKIEVNKATNRLYLYQGNQVKKVYPVATGRQPAIDPGRHVSRGHQNQQTRLERHPGRRSEKPAGRTLDGSPRERGPGQNLRHPRHQSTRVDREICFQRLHPHAEPGRHRIIEAGSDRYTGLDSQRQKQSKTTRETERTTRFYKPPPLRATTFISGPPLP